MSYRTFMIPSALCIVAYVLLGGAAVADEAVPVYTGCEACHGPGGDQPIPGMLAPKLSGLDAAYLVKQLHDFKYGRRTFEAMNTMAKGLSEADIQADAAYFAAQTRTPDEVTNKELAKQGEQIVKHAVVDQAFPACVNCHNDGLTGTFRYPRLAGQKSDYVINQLTHLKSGERHNDFGQMQRVAMRLTDAQIKAVAEYISTLPSEHEFVSGLQGHW
jgi:cytochrome c553